MRKVLTVLAASTAAAALAIESHAQSTAPSTRPATDRSAVTTAGRPTTMFTAIMGAVRLGRPASPALRPPLRRGYNPAAAIDPSAPGGSTLRSRAQATSRRADGQTTATGPATAATGPTTANVVRVVMASSRPATRPAPTPTPLKIDLDNADGAALTAALGLPVNLQGPRQMTGPRAWTVLPATPLTYHGPGGTFAAGVTDFFQNSGLTVLENYSSLTLSPGKPMRAMNLNDAGALVLTHLTLQARRNVRNNLALNYDYRVDGVFVPDPALRLISVTSNGTLRLADSVETRRPVNDFSSGNGNRISLNFTSDKPVKKTDVLVGRLRGMRVVDELVLDVPFEQIADSQPVEADGLTATVDVDPAMGGRAAQLRVKLKGKPVSLFSDFRWSNAARQCVRVLGPDDAPLPVEVYVQESKNESVTLSVRSTMRAADFYDRLTTVSVRLPRALKAVDLPFTLEGVEFPDE